MGQNAVRNENRRKFLLGFFHQDIPHKEAIELNGFIIYKHWRGDIKDWTAEIFTKDGYRRLAEYQSVNTPMLL